MAKASHKHDERTHFNDHGYLITFGVITVSDSCFFHAVEDKSGKTLVNLINNEPSYCGVVCKKIIVSDDIDAIKDVLLQLCDEEKLNVVVTTGGTGFSIRDVTPEATKQVIEKHAPALSTAMTLASLKQHKYSMLSRAVCGIRKNTIIINLPGSPKAVKECYEVFCNVLQHAVNVLGEFISIRMREEEKKRLTRMLQSNIQDIIVINKCDLSAESLQQLYDRKKEAIVKQLQDISPGNDFCSTEKNKNVSGGASLEEQPKDLSSKVSVKDVASRPRESPYKIKMMEEAINCVKEEWETIGCCVKNLNYDNLHEIVGYVLVNDVYSTVALPPFPASIKDGYAVIAEDGKGIRKVIGTSTAGSHPAENTVQSGSCIRINTGAPVPGGANAVIQIEDTELLESCQGEEVQIELLKSPTAGQDIRMAGSDINVGDKVFSKNSVIGPGEIATAASVGHVHFEVYNRPEVAVLTTGNEIVEPWNVPGPGQIRDCNKSGLLALFRSQGFSVHDAKIASDNPTVLLKELKYCLSIADVLVITGGVSMGEKDFVKEVLEKDLGVNIHFGRIFMKPGKPTTFGSVVYGNKKKLIFGLPGNPVSAMVTAQLFVLPTLRAKSGHPSPFPTTIKAKLGAERKLDPRPEYLRVMLRWDNDEVMPIAIPSTSYQLSSNISSMVNVNGLAVLPSASSTASKLEKGTVVSVLVIDKI